MNIKRLTAYYLIATLCVFIGVSAAGRMVYEIFHDSLNLDLSVLFFFIGKGLFERNKRAIKFYCDFLVLIFILLVVVLGAVLVFHAVGSGGEWSWERHSWQKNVCIGMVLLGAFWCLYKSHRFMSSEWVRVWSQGDADVHDAAFYRVSWILSLLLTLLLFVYQWTYDTVLDKVAYYSVSVTAVDEVSGEPLNGLSVTKSQLEDGFIKELGVMSSGTSLTVSWLGDTAMELTVGSEGYQDIVLNDIKAGASERTVVLKRLASATEQKSPGDSSRLPLE